MTLKDALDMIHPCCTVSILDCLGRQMILPMACIDAPRYDWPVKRIDMATDIRAIAIYVQREAI